MQSLSGTSPRSRVVPLAKLADLVRRTAGPGQADWPLRHLLLAERELGRHVAAPSGVDDRGDESRRAAVTNEGKGCWSDCGAEGACPGFCGPKGACCRQGFGTTLAACGFAFGSLASFARTEAALLVRTPRVLSFGLVDQRRRRTCLFY